MKITKYGHACLLVEEAGARLLIDPGAYSKGFEAEKDLDAILVTHKHQDHITVEVLKALRDVNPEAPVFADAASAHMLEVAGFTGVKAVQAGDEFEVKGVKLAVFGRDHALLHSSMPVDPNVGFLIAGRLFVPGDSYTVPGVPVEILGLPVGGPWLMVSDMIDYLLDVKPKIAIPIHDATLSSPDMHVDMASRAAGPAGITIKVIPNGESAEL